VQQRTLKTRDGSGNIQIDMQTSPLI